MKKTFLLLILLLVLWVTACTGSRPSTVSTDQADAGTNQEGPTQETQTVKPALNVQSRNLLDTYTANFLVEFNGTTAWKYQTLTRRTPELREVNLHIEGLKDGSNPGDIRMLSDQTNTWMIGAGTDEECVQFPNSEDLNPDLLYPENIIPVQDLIPLLTYVGDEPVAGKQAAHFSGKAASLAGWSDVQVDIWEEKGSGALLQYSMKAQGEDKYFKTGSGMMTANYRVENVDEPMIASAPDCRITVPLPDTAQKFIRLPGMASFESSAPMEQVRDFYLAQLPQASWVESEPLAQSQTSVVLSYRRDAEAVEVHIESTEAGGSQVKLLFLPVQ